MTLVYLADGERRVVAEDLKDEQEALTAMMQDQKNRFVYQTGVITIDRTPKYFSFKNAAGVDSGYRLER